jgi:hypothetical protein
MRHWTNHIVAVNATSWLIQSMEWEWDYDMGEDLLSDVDEPAVSYGMLFTTPEAAIRYAEKHGIRVSNHNPIHTYR